MKKMRLIALVLVLAMILCIPAVAAETTVDGEKATATIKMAGTTAEFKENGDMVTVTVTSTSLKAGSQYVILMVKSADGDNYTIDANSILYIDQTAASASGANGTVTFDVYPSSMTDGVILIAGAEDGLLTAAIIKGKYLLGDVNGDKVVTSKDALEVLRYAVGLVKFTDTQKSAAAVLGNKDEHGNAKPTTKDALSILRVALRITEEFE